MKHKRPEAYIRMKRCIDTVKPHWDSRGRTGSSSGCRRPPSLSDLSDCLWFHLKKQKLAIPLAASLPATGLSKHGQRFVSVSGWAFVSHKH